MNKRGRSSRIFFGWWMTIVSGLVTGLGNGISMHGSSALFKPIASELGFTRAATSVAASIRRLEFGLLAPITGWLVDRFGPRWIVIVGISLMGIGLASMNYVNSTWSYYVVWGLIMGAGSTLGLTMTIDKALTNWFVRKRGLAFAIRFLFIGIVGATIIPIITLLVTTKGWRTTCVIWAGAMFLSVPVMGFFMKQKRPEYYGLLPDGASIESGVEENAVSSADEDAVGSADEDVNAFIYKGVAYAADFQETEFTLNQAMRTPAFWMLTAADACAMIIVSGINLHCIPFITDMGIDPTVAGGMMGLMVFFTIPSGFFSGFIADRVRKDHLKFLLAGAFLFQALGITAFLLNQTIVMVYVLLIFYGFGAGGHRPLLIVMRGRYFGRKAYGFIEGTSMMFQAPITLLAPVYTGWVHDRTGSYISAFMLFAALAAAATCVMCLVRVPNPPKPPTPIE